MLRGTVAKTVIALLAVSFIAAVALHAEEASPGPTGVESSANIPEGYEIGDKSVSPNGRFGILYPIRGSDDKVELPPNLLVCLNRTQY
jgi:hypothetical protein